MLAGRPLGQRGPARRLPPTARGWVLWLARAAALLYAVALVLLTHLPEVSAGSTGSPLVPMDKLAHVVAFGLLFAVLAMARPIGAAAPYRVTLLLAAGAALLLAWGIEQTQPMTGRTRDHADLLAGAGGILSGYIVLGARPLLGGWGWLVWPARLAGLVSLPALVSATLSPEVGSWLVHQARDMGVHREMGGVLHFYVSWALVLLLAATALLGRTRPRLSAAATIAGLAASALVIEWIQPYTGRGPASLADVAAHMRGMLAGLAIWAVAATCRDGVAGLVRFGGGGRTGARAEAAEEPDGDHAAEAGGSTLAGHTALISGLTVVSRITGLARDATLAAIFGVSAIADAFFIGFLVPNLFRRLFGEGALAAAFIPRYSELRQRDPALARRFAGLSLAGLVTLLGLITLLGEGVLWLMLRAGPWSASGGLTIELTMWMLPYMPLVCAVALMGGMLQVRRRFGPPAAAPIVLNLCVIAAALGASLGNGGGIDQSMVARATAAAVLVAGVLQLLWQWRALGRTASVSLDPAGVGPPMKRMARAMLPLVLGLAVFQLNAFLDSLIALLLSTSEPGASFRLLGWQLPYPMATGAVASLQWAQRLYQFPLGVFGIAVATAIFPALAEAASARPSGAEPGTGARADADRLARLLRQGLRLTLFIALPASAGLLLVRTPLVRVIYERGAFTLEDSQRVAMILAGYAGAVWAYSLSHVVTRCFYAVGDETAPVRVGASMVAVNLALNLGLIWPLGVAGLAWSTAICAAIQSVWLLRTVKRHVTMPIDASVRRGWGRTIALTVAMTLVVGAVGWWLDASALGWWGALGWLALLVGLGALIVLGGAWLMRAAELRWLIKREPEAGD